MQCRGEHARAAAMWERGRQIAADGQARLLLDLADLIPPQDPAQEQAVPAELAELAPRDFEVAGLVADGLSDQAIATRLYLSRRTVETPLSTVYRKAGLPARAALAGFMALSGRAAGA
ncbi:helix-turn-helix transcriptional regulator [Streptomyces sp. NPDC046759]|uniref:helix-turn-helix domain-containing protein n=1 Tax=Streptomyces sp. NPDC046759 TaxID=3155019 RepID=UPI00340AD00C